MLKESQLSVINSCNRILELLKIQPRTVYDIRDILGVKYNVAYKYLEILVGEDLVKSRPIMTHTHGGMRNRYSLTEKGMVQNYSVGLINVTFNGLNEYWPCGTIIKTQAATTVHHLEG